MIEKTDPRAGGAGAADHKVALERCWSTEKSPRLQTRVAAIHDKREFAA
jgi:hypothetical protein